MALGATIYNFDVQLMDFDRNIFETLALRVAQHPSESDAYLVTRMLAYCLEYTDGISFSKGVADPEDPMIAIRDLTGAFCAWIDIGAPDAARVHKASKASPRVAIYTHKSPEQLVKQWGNTKIHRIEAIELYAVDQDLIAALVEKLERRMALTLSVTAGQLYITLGDGVIEGAVLRCAL